MAMKPPVSNREALAIPTKGMSLNLAVDSPTPQA
jgi:hypothetical protein